MLYQLEPAADVYEEMLPLLRAHYKEIAHYQDIEFSPNKEQYLQLDSLGMTRVFTARNENHVLLGYAVYFVRHNLHYSKSLQAVQDVIYIDKENRGFGKDFIAWCDLMLQSEGVQAVYHHVKAEHNWGKMLERMGYKLVDLIYARRLDQKES